MDTEVLVSSLIAMALTIGGGDMGTISYLGFLPTLGMIFFANCGTAQARARNYQESSIKEPSSQTAAVEKIYHGLGTNHTDEVWTPGRDQGW